MYKILILDDEQIERDCLVFLIQQFSFPCEIKEADNGYAALTLLQEWHADIILTDIQMPVLNGLDFIGQINQLSYTPKLIIFSNYAEFEYAKVAMHLGVENYILKPVIPSELKTTLQELMAQIDLERDTKLHKESYLLQYAIQLDIYGNLVHQNFEESILHQLSSFRYMILFDFSSTFLEENYSVFLERMKQHFHITFESLNLSPQALLCIYDEIGNMNVFTNDVYEFILNEFHISCYLSISKSLQEYSSLKEAFSMVEQQMEQKFWNPLEHIFTAESLQQNDTNTAISNSYTTTHLDNETLISMIKTSLTAKDKLQLEQNLEQFFSNFNAESNQSQIYTKFIFSNLIITLFPFLPERKKQDKTIDTIISELYMKQNIDEIIGIVRQMSDDIITTLSSKKKELRKEIVIVKEYIHNNYSKELSIELLASIVYLSPDYLSRLFKNATSVSLYQYIRQFRMQKASELLLTTTKKIIDIGMETGYPNYSYFCQSFREYFGKSPEKYRLEKANEMGL